MAEEEWRKQYELIFRTLVEESHRYWSRYNTSILINGGLVVAFSSLMSFAQKTLGLSVSTIGLFAISIVGIIFSVLWYKITITANSWSKFWHNKLQKIETEHIEKDLRVFPNTGEVVIKGSVTSRALWYPRIFIGFWILIVLTLVFLLLKWISL